MKIRVVNEAIDVSMSDRDYWERHARRYDASLKWVLGRPLPRMLELASEAVRGKRRVLEVAAGTGIITSAIAQASDSVVATDYAAAMVKALEQRVQDAGCKSALKIDPRLHQEPITYETNQRRNWVKCACRFTAVVRSVSRRLSQFG